MGWAVQVSGIPGSGKSWLGEALRAAGLRVLDTDEVIAKVVRPKDTYNEAVRRGAKFARKAILEAAGLTVVVGTMFRVAGAERYHITIGQAELGKAWRRVLAREIDKYAVHRKGLEEALRRVPARTLPDYLMLRYGIGALDIMTTREAYGQMEKAARAEARRKGAALATQREVRARILRLGARRSR